MTIKSKTKFLVFVIILLLLILPTINYLKHEGEKDFKFRRSSLFNIDYIITPVQKMVFGLGISLNPQQAYIGKEGWVFLGDSYQSGISSRRSGLTTEDQQVAEKIKLGLLKWNEFFKANGVDDFLIMLGPDKATIYPEYLPNWAKPADLVRTDAVLGDIGSSLFFDTRKALLEAKKVYENRVYYKTDTHWNNLGAWIAFDGFIKELSSKSVNDGIWLKDEDVSFYQYNGRHGGDLSNFLRLRDYLSDEEPVYKINESDYFSVNSVEKRTGDLKNSEIIKNNKALNWLFAFKGVVGF